MLRFVDRNDINEVIKETSDFKIRSHGSFILWITYGFIISVIFILFFVRNVLDTLISIRSEEVIPLGDIVSGVAFIILIMLFLAGYVYLIVGRIRSIVQITEFQTAIFSGVARVDVLFCFVLHKSKTLIYYDRKSEKVLEGHIKDLKDILAYEGIQPKDKLLIEKAVIEGQKIVVPFSYMSDGNRKLKGNIRVDPIDRPAGFVAIRGYAE